MMQLIVRDGWKPGATTVAAFNRGVQAMGDPDVEVVLTAKFDETVREYTGSTTYTAGRGSGAVGPRH